MSQCPSSGTLLHFLSFGTNGDIKIQDFISKQQTVAVVQQQQGHQNLILNLSTSKVGFSGSANGQLQITVPNLHGLELRFCDSNQLSSSFAEAQESLMAGSLTELQNVNVMAEGRGGSGSVGNSTTSSTSGHSSSLNGKSRDDDEKDAFKPRIDSMNGLGDCWVEFRANVKKPAGYLKNVLVSRTNSMTAGGAGKTSRIAKAPTLPYE